jgi:pimeloyl-ACP methyl ester carboxylesterase
MKKMKKTIMGAGIAALVLLSTMAAHTQGPAAQQDGPPQGRGGGGGRGARQPAGPPTKTTFLQLTNSSNAVLIEPVTLNSRSRIVVIRTHPEHVNNLNTDGRPLVDYGYRVMALNYYGREQIYYEFIPPLAAAIKAARAIPGVEKVVLLGFSTGGPEVTSYQDVAENGPKACQEPGRVYKCDGKGLDNLPKADGVMLLESAAGAPERTDALNPAVSPHDWHVVHPELDMFSPKNGYDPATKSATYSAEFLKQYFAAQAARAAQLIEEAQARLAKIEKGEGAFKDDEPFVVVGTTLAINGARPLLADTRLMGHVHAPHMLLKADGSRPVIAYPLVMDPEASAQGNDQLFSNTQDTTVKTYLSFQALRVSPDYHMTEDNIVGVDWRSVPNSLEGNVQGIRVPTLFVSGTCAPHIVYQEIAYDLSAAKDKDLVGVEGANHGLTACKPEYGDASKRAYDYVDSWLMNPGRF